MTTLPIDNSENEFSNKSIGEKLKSARIAQNRSLDDIAASTKLIRCFLRK